MEREERQLSSALQSAPPVTVALGELVQSVDTFQAKGEALARDLGLERYGGRIAGGFMAAFIVTMFAMIAAGQYPGRSDAIKIAYAIFQVVGDVLALLFCVRMTFLLRGAMQHVQQQFLMSMTRASSRDDVQAIRNELQAAKRSWLAWVFLSLGVALYAIGQMIFVSYDVRMDPAVIPFPGLYDVAFVGMYPLFLVGALLLSRRGGEAGVGRVRLLLDALAIVGAALAFSWFFVVGPSIAKLYGGPAAKFLTFYFPAGDLLLVAVGSFSLFNPFSAREQESVFVRLFWGLGLMAISDSLLAYEILNVDYRTGLLRILLNPLSVLFIGLAAIKYPQAVAREQERLARATRRRSAGAIQVYVSQIGSSLRTIAPFVLALFTCTILITAVASRGGVVLIQATLSALILIVLVVIRQALTMIENTRLTLQLRGELVSSQRALDVTRQEIDIVSREAQEKRGLEDGVAMLRNAHSRVARGDFSARATIMAGPLMPLAISFNLMLDRLLSLRQQIGAYEQLRTECKNLQVVVDRLSKGVSLWSVGQIPIQRTSELGPVLIQLMHLQRAQQHQWHTEMQMLEAVRTQTQRLHEQLVEIGQRSKFTTNRELASQEHILHAVEQIEQQVAYLFEQLEKRDVRSEQSSVQV